MKPTLVIGCSENPERYSFKAVSSLRKHGHFVIGFGLRNGQIGDTPITNQWNAAWEVDTVTLYLNPSRQKELYNQIIALQPKRVIFNPGTENSEFEMLLESAQIEVEIACTLVLLSVGNY